ncbi:MAG TPA: YtxH domain-containing protein [Flavobacterium sp.]|jgi:gas vesicle protein|nr:YtxH domain-containing protein [Flavobacterium sp.]
MGTGKMVLGILAGVALGSVIGIFLAPAKGVETRRKIRTSSTDFFGNFKNKYNHLIDEITSTLDSVAHHTDASSNGEASEPTNNSTSAIL